MRGVNLNAKSDKKENKLKPSMGQHIATIMEDGKLSALYATFTTAAGLGTLLDYLPDFLGVAATMSGLILTWVMICRTRLQIKVLKQESEEE